MKRRCAAIPVASAIPLTISLISHHSAQCGMRERIHQIGFSEEASLVRSVREQLRRQTLQRDPSTSGEERCSSFRPERSASAVRSQALREACAPMEPAYRPPEFHRESQLQVFNLSRISSRRSPIPICVSYVKQESKERKSSASLPLLEVAHRGTGRLFLTPEFADVEDMRTCSG